jgi:hypothetical protein
MSPFTGAARLIAIAACSGAAVLSSTANGSGNPGALMGMLPQGFSSANCAEATADIAPALEEVNCLQTSDPALPGLAVFVLYGNLNDLATWFQNFAQAPSNGMTVVSCPGGQASPGTWTGGQVECGTVASDGTTNSAVVWTNNAKLMGNYILGTPTQDLASLYQWWSTNSG